MNEKQVSIMPKGIYYICPHCKEQMKVEYKCNYCPDCGGKLGWDNVKEYNEIKSHYCWNEDTDGFCKYYRRQCFGSLNCDYVKSQYLLSDDIGKLTSSEKKNILIEKGYK